MVPGPVPPELYRLVHTSINTYTCIGVLNSTTFLQGLTQIEEMLISAVLPIMSLYRFTSWAVRFQWACYQPDSGCRLLC